MVVKPERALAHSRCRRARRRNTGERCALESVNLPAVRALYTFTDALAALDVAERTDVVLLLDQLVGEIEATA